ILTNLDQSIQQSKQITKENEEYEKTFEKVLSNTKNGGADNTQVFHFLSRPIQGKGVFGQTRQISLGPYYATLTGAILLTVAGLSLLGFMKKRKATEANLLVQPTRTRMNEPNVFMLSFVTILLAGFYAAATSATAGKANRLCGGTYAFMA
ncbi:type VII secretion protein EsaA, partial [Enterococcus faecium]|nr:type VII secretion protein EsaA [Enterococcus faecium]